MRLVINSAATEALDHFSKEGTWSRAGHEYRADRWRERMGNPQQFRQVPQTNAPAKAAAAASVQQGAADRATKHIMDFQRGKAQNRAAGWNRELGQTFGRVDQSKAPARAAAAESVAQSARRDAAKTRAATWRGEFANRSVSQSRAPARAAAEASERQTALRAAAQKRAQGWKSEFAARQVDQGKGPARAAAQASADQTAAAAAAKAKADAAEKVRLKTNWDEAAAKRAANKPPPRGAPKPSGPLHVGVTAEGRKLQEAHTRAGIWRNTLASDSSAVKRAAKMRKLGKVGAAAGTAAAALGTAAAVPKILASRGAAKAAAAKAAKVKQIKTAGILGGGALGANYLMNKSEEPMDLVEIKKGYAQVFEPGAKALAKPLSRSAPASKKYVKAFEPKKPASINAKHGGQRTEGTWKGFR